MLKKTGRLYEIRQTVKHRREVQRIAHSLGYSFPFHDLVKLWNIAIFGDRLATKWHRLYSAHHEQNGDIKSKVEAAIDWESARFSKPDKPLTAYQTWQRYYSHIDMAETLQKLGFTE